MNVDVCCHFMPTSDIDLSFFMCERVDWVRRAFHRQFLCEYLPPYIWLCLCIFVYNCKLCLQENTSKYFKAFYKKSVKTLSYKSSKYVFGKLFICLWTCHLLNLSSLCDWMIAHYHPSFHFLLLEEGHSFLYQDLVIRFHMGLSGLDVHFWNLELLPVITVHK